MAEWVTIISSLATGAGTLVLAVATFASVRSANRAARTAERALQVGLRPVLAPSRPQDPADKILFADDHWLTVRGGEAVVESSDGVVYLALGLRNVGMGLAVLRGWRVTSEALQGLGGVAYPTSISEFRSQQRDLYVPAGDVGFWQGAVRDGADPLLAELRTIAADRRGLTIDLLYGDHEGGQRRITRFVLTPRQASGWLCSATRHWNVDHP
jgi:hypothetical protein